ncbi:MAG TPA: hypothetical protein VMT18_01870 [Planctomycetota bacterium]|nr:hypothetical protein [Planctomycetota bacterium]
MWLLGIALGAAFLAIAVLRNDRRLKLWLRIALGQLTLFAFARALLVFVDRHG